MPIAGILPTLSWVENFTTTHLTSAAGSWAETAALWDKTFTQLASDIQRPGGTEWEGPAAEASQASVDKAQFAVRGGANQIHDAAGAANFGADQLDGLHRKTLDAIAQARGDGFDVNDDGSSGNRVQVGVS